MSSSKLYKRADQRWLGLLAAWQWASTWLFAFACWFYFTQPLYLYLSIGVFSLAVLHRYLFLLLFAKKVQESRLWFWMPLVLPFHQLMHVFWGMKGLLFKAKW